MMENDRDFYLIDSSCTCWTGHPPCSYCIDTFTCDECGHRAYSDILEEHKKYGFICENCQYFYEPKGFKYWFSLALAWLFLIALFGTLIIVYNTYVVYKDYRNNNYQLPNFIRFVYEYNFTQIFYTKIIKNGQK